MIKKGSDWLVYTQAIVTRTATGHRMREAVRERPKYWDYSSNLNGNITDAINYAKAHMLYYHISHNVCLHRVINGRRTGEVYRIFQAKWGHDNRPFMRYDYDMLKYIYTIPKRG